MMIQTQEQVKNGFTVEEDDHCLYLLLKDDRVAIFSATGTTKEAIREIADAIHAQRINKEGR